MRMKHERALWIGGFIVGFVIGMALSLLYTWVIDPPPLNDTTPAALNPQDKEVYTVLIAAAHVAEGDLDRTRKRLAELEDPDIENTIVVLAERYINEGRDARDIRALARLADALGGTSAAMRPFIATPTPIPTLTSTPTPYPPTSTPTQVVRSSPTPTLTPPPRRTSTVESADAFKIVQSTALCDPTTNGLLRVYVRDGTGRGVPGVQVLVNWPGGEDRFFTGFKPEADPGYADFEMESSEIYQVELLDVESEMADGVGDSLADLCPGLPAQVQPSWQIVFQAGE
jgi:hypothetical protein